MRKIANTNELQTELRRLIAYTQSERPSRVRLASLLMDLSYKVAAVDPDKFEQFSKAYRDGLAKAVKADPDDYMLKSGETPEKYAERVSDKMLAGIKTNPSGVNYDGGGFKNACKALGIKATRKAIFEFLGHS